METGVGPHELHVDSLIEPEPEYGAVAPATDVERPALGPGEQDLARAAARSRVTRRVRREAEGEMDQLWGHVFFAVEHLPPKSIIVTSARRGDGATQIATALALTGASANKELRIALVDFNLRNPRVAGLLGLNNEPGLTDVLEGRATLEAAVRALEFENGNELHVLTGGTPARQPLGLLKSRQVQTLMGRLHHYYDHTIIDVTCANAYPDPHVIGSMVDGAVVVARPGDTPRETVSEAKRRLDLAGVRCLGLVLNQRSDPVPDVLYKRL